MPACIYGNKKIINTRDGSYTFYSMEYNESYKTKSVGAYTESLHKFVNGTNIPQDDTVFEFDCEGKPTVQLPDDSPVKQAVRDIVQRLHL